MKILVVGMGAVGGYFGGRLLSAGRDVTFLVRKARAARGLDIQSRFGNVHLPDPPVIVAGDVQEPFDLVLLSCKAQDLTGAIHSFAPLVGERTLILPLLNGMRHLTELDSRFGGDRVLGGVCFISAVRDADGRILHLNDMHRLLFGERDGSGTARMEKIAAVLSNSGFEAQWTQAIVQEMWDKWIFIATLAGMSCLMRSSIGGIVAAGAADLTLALLEECTAVCAQEGFPPTAAFLNRNRQLLTQNGSPLTASMLRDVESGAPVEADHILGDLLERGHKHQISTPLLRIAYTHLKCYEARRTGT
jgi:2-dehydropantoate 2-reductase